MAYLARDKAVAPNYTLDHSPITLGRDSKNDLVLESDMRASRAHAEIQHRSGEWLLRDLHSRNGTFANGRRITEHALRGGDVIRVGTTILMFCTGPDPFETAADEAAMRPPPPPSPLSNLSAREREILALVATGATNQQIAAALFISPSTVGSHLDRIRDKTGCRRRPELTRLAVRLRLLD